MSLDGADFSSMNGILGERRRVSTARMSNGITTRQDSGGIEDTKHDELPRNGTLAPGGENGQWSSAVGHATTAGKSGRVIERLMADNDRMKRELEIQLLRSQELERNLQTLRPQLDALRTENDNLSHAKNMDSSLLKRRDRKIEQLKEEATSERTRRESSEGLARRLQSEKDEVIELSRREVQRAQEEAKHSTTHASIMEQSHRQLAAQYHQRADRWRKDFEELRERLNADAPKVARLAIISDQMASALEQNNTAQAEYMARFEAYKAASEDWQAGLETVAIEEIERTRKLNQDMETVTKDMKWLMGMKQARQGG